MVHFEGLSMSHLTQEKVIKLGLERNIIMIQWLSAGLGPFLGDRLLNKGLPLWLRGKELVCQCRRHRFNPWVGKIPWRRERLPTPVFLPGESHGQRNMVGNSPWGCKESDKTEATKQAGRPCWKHFAGIKYTHSSETHNNPVELSTVITQFYW